MKKARHELIKEIIEQSRIETQDDLTAALLLKGVKVTQATVSRDIKEMRLYKVSDVNGHYFYTCPKVQNILSHDGVLSQTVRTSIVKIKMNDSLVVIHTVPGSAASVAFALDNMNFEEILGTIAGDDTIFVAVANAEAGNNIVQKLKNLI